MEDQTKTQIKAITISLALAIIVGVLVFYGMGVPEWRNQITEITAVFHIIAAILITSSLIKWRGFTKFNIALAVLNAGAIIFNVLRLMNYI